MFAVDPGQRRGFISHPVGMPPMLPGCGPVTVGSLERRVPLSEYLVAFLQCPLTLAFRPGSVDRPPVLPQECGFAQFLVGLSDVPFDPLATPRDRDVPVVRPTVKRGDVTAETGATHQWLRGGDPPSCLTVAQQAWTEGAHFYPLPPERLSEDRLEYWVTRNNLVYSVAGTTETYVVRPANAEADCI